MALTFRSNGVGGGLVSAAWWNDYYNLFTGTMTDQWITISNGLTLMGDSATGLGDASLSLQSGTTLGIGSYTYAISFVMGDGECGHSAGASITTTSGNQKVFLTGIPTGPAGTKGRNIYRSKVGTSSPLYLVTTINDNTSTTYTDTTPDTSLVTQPPSASSFGGSLVIKTEAGTKTLQLYKNGSIWADTGNFRTDGSGNVNAAGLTLAGNLSMGSGTHVSLDNGSITSNGSGILATLGLSFSSNSGIAANMPGNSITGTTSGSATLYQPLTGTIKLAIVFFNNYRNASATEQTISLPTPFTTWSLFFAGTSKSIRPYLSGTALTSKVNIVTANATGTTSGSTTAVNATQGFSYGDFSTGFDALGLGTNETGGLTGLAWFLGI